MVCSYQFLMLCRFYLWWVVLAVQIAQSQVIYRETTAVIVSGPHALFAANFPVPQYTSFGLITPSLLAIIINHITNPKLSTYDTVKNSPEVGSPQLSNMFIPRDPINTRWQRHLNVVGSFLKLENFFPELIDIILQQFFYPWNIWSFLLIKRTAYLNLAFALYLCSNSGSCHTRH